MVGPLLLRVEGRWACTNFYYEGVSTGLYNAGSAELVEESLNVQAVEKSVIYYLTPEDEDSLADEFPGFFQARRILNMRLYMQHRKRAVVFHAVSEARVQAPAAKGVKKQLPFYHFPQRVFVAKQASGCLFGKHY